MVLTRLEVMLNMKSGALQMTSFSDLLLKVIQSTIKVRPFFFVIEMDIVLTLSFVISFLFVITKGSERQSQTSTIAIL